MQSLYLTIRDADPMAGIGSIEFAERQAHVVLDRFATMDEICGEPLQEARVSLRGD
ncbi:MAG: hypothetical protein AB1646_14575 [Thermodesulfobacteriota bacterium]